MPSTDSDTTTPLALPAGTRLGDFELRAVLATSGFGFVYEAHDHELNRRVAIKEFMPALLASRSADGVVAAVSPAQAATFDYGLRSFVNEARFLAGLDHPSLVRVYQFWRAHGTAYFVMPRYGGRTLDVLRAASAEAVPESTLRAVLDGVLGALELLHGKNIVHCGVAPDSILLTAQGTPVLLDFGAARLAMAGAAPAELRDFNGTELHGPWTDFYALGGTLRYLLTGQKPPPAHVRALKDELASLASQGVPGVSSSLLEVIDWMLALRPEKRPQNAQQIRAALHGEPGPPASPTSAAVVEAAPPVPPPEPAPTVVALPTAMRSTRPSHAAGWLAGALSLAAAAGLWLYAQDRQVVAPVAAPSAAVVVAPPVAVVPAPVASAVVVETPVVSAPVVVPAPPAPAPALAIIEEKAAVETPAPVKRVVAPSPPKLSPDMAAALARAQAARAAIDERGRPRSPAQP